MHLTEERPAPRQLPEILAVGGGKGGVGKTCFAVNAAVEIARRGWRVVLLDADLGCSNVEAVLGVRAEARLDAYFSPRPASLDALLTETPYENLRLIAGTSGLIDYAHPRSGQKRSLIKDLQALEADLVIVDLDAGAHLNTLDFFGMRGADGAVIITPERTSIDNAFKFLRAVLFRHIEGFYASPEVGLLLRRAHTVQEFAETLRTSPCFDGDTGEHLAKEVLAVARGFRPQIVVNKANNAYEAKIAANILTKFLRQHLGVAPHQLGFLCFDRYVSEAVNSGVPFVAAKPQRAVSGCVLDIVNRLGFF